MTVYRVFNGEQLVAIASSAVEAWRLVESARLRDQSSVNLWTVEHVDRDVPSVDGIEADWGVPGRPLPHVSWNCPICGKQHDTDIGVDEASPGMWTCEMGTLGDIVLVKWT